MRSLLMLLTLLAMPAYADLQLHYNGFYGRMKKLQQPEYSDITLAFALIGERSGQPCRFYSLKLLSDQHDISLDTAGNGEISLPYDEALKNSNALLQVYQADNAEPCQVQFRLRSRMRLPMTLDYATLAHYQQQFDVLLDDMAGLGKYWLPEVAGVIVQLADDDTPTLDPEAKRMTVCEKDRCEIRLDDAAAMSGHWQFSRRPLYLLPLINNGTL
ncbi:MAG: DUF2987 domain-containing protein [Gammaproteobacteria bacterium]|nr:DUF2987 domain-containing protein [Gammaproteobacteria bacterium]MBU1555478.1 DUF2987 domain-containing protein [Gammaproteobacteria bacterium]MBU2072515.1 DUF2987 domain-containing protein [Gammaproteobacteria bacterium]MBU2181935.1 DUF2987 domain-containing protein [Gammaproteobacteria bacterium]MBU2204241.1 DUF2987 domain-containing protein [Gammaproteobacteria bacterium]